MAPLWRAALLWAWLAGIPSGVLCADTGPRAAYWINGKVTFETREPFGAGGPSVLLEGIRTPFRTTVDVHGNGKFSIADVPPGTYCLTLFAPFYRPLQRTVEVGPSRADSSGRIDLVIEFEYRPPRDAAFMVDVHQLTVPERAPMELEKVDRLLSRRNIDEARRRLADLVRATPRFSGAWYRLGTIAYRSGELTEAEHCMREAIRWDPNAYAPLVSLGGILLAQERHSEALPVNLEALERRTDDPLAQSQTGESYFRGGDLDLARFHLERARELEPGHYSYPQLLLARIHKIRNEPLAELAVLEEYLRFHPDAPQAQGVRAELEGARARAAAASSALER